MNALRILAERSADERRVLAEGHEQPPFVATFTELSVPLLLVLSVARHLDAEGRTPRAVFVYGDNGEIDGIAIEAKNDVAARRPRIEPDVSVVPPAHPRTVDDPRRYEQVGWYYAFEEYRCLAHKPTPPRDEMCSKVYAGDVKDQTYQTCEVCAAPLVAQETAQ